MYLKLLIEGIARQTTVLLAQLSTSSGVRAPLSRLADQVFLNLAKEIEAQGVSKAVVADMFGLALRSYQKKTRRIEQSSQEATRTLWKALFDFIQEEERERSRIMERFRNDGEREVGAVLSDLVASGLIYSSGSGARTVYGATSAKTRRSIQEAADLEALANVIWVELFQQNARNAGELVELLEVSPDAVNRAVEALLQSGRVRDSNGSLEAANVVIRVGTEGKEAAMLDHFRAVARVLAKRAAAPEPSPDEGGATFVFSVCAGHPFEHEVRSLYRKHRAEVANLWELVSAHNQRINLHKSSADRVTFYLGQSSDEQDVEDQVPHDAFSETPPVGEPPGVPFNS